MAIRILYTQWLSHINDICSTEIHLIRTDDFADTRCNHHYQLVGKGLVLDKCLLFSQEIKSSLWSYHFIHDEATIKAKHFISFMVAFILSTSGLTHFLGNQENNLGMKRGVSPTCEQSVVSLAPLFLLLLEMTSLFLLENSVLELVHKWANPSKMVG